jgi:hypothetical protein
MQNFVMIEIVIVEIKIIEISVHANKQSLLLLHLKPFASFEAASIAELNKPPPRQLQLYNSAAAGAEYSLSLRSFLL